MKKWICILLTLTMVLLLTDAYAAVAGFFPAGGFMQLLAVVLGAIIYYVPYQFVIWLGMSGDDMKLITALIVAVFLAIPYWKGKYFSKPVKIGGGNHA